MAYRPSAVLAISGLLAGCVTGPSRDFVRTTSQDFLDRNHVCALMPAHGRYGEALFVRDSQIIAPFVGAGLVKIVGAPSGRQATTDTRTWFETTKLGDELSDQCLTNANAYPQQYGWGFKIGRREIIRIGDPGKPTKLRCFSIASVAVNWCLRMDAQWFDPKRFSTNLTAYHFDPEIGKGLAIVPYSKVGKVWSQQDLADPHSNFACVEMH